MLIPAAQYVRMSDDTQQFSIANQKAAIQEYAERNGFTIIRTYEDAGRSGVTLERRPALRRLLQDVVANACAFKSILVYDVSRWGRFQNNDESAHYEFLCSNAGIPLHYCAEPFANDNSTANIILKAIKRSMAAEFSRELGVKVHRGKVRLAQMGFWVGAVPGFGLRRLMISAEGKPKQEMKFGERKNLATDRVVLTPGPKYEVDCVRFMFAMVIQKRMGCAAIARLLNNQGIFINGRPWRNHDIKNILTNPKYCGCNRWNKIAGGLGKPRRQNSPELWIKKFGAFEPIVDETTFEEAQVKLPKRADSLWSEKEMLKKLRSLLAAKGRLSESLILAARGMPGATTLREHFGTYRQIYKLIGYNLPEVDFYGNKRADKVMKLRRALVSRILNMFSEHVTVEHLPGGFRSLLRVDKDFLVSILLCSPYRAENGKPCWAVESVAREHRYITLVGRVSATREIITNLAIFPEITFRSRILREHDPWYESGARLRKLGDFYSLVKSIHDKKQAILYGT